MTRALFLLPTLALMCDASASDMPPFKLGHPLCQTGFSLSQRFDTRDRFDWIVKRQWKMTGCAKGRIVYHDPLRFNSSPPR
jgi:hypothetical protein